MLFGKKKTTYESLHNTADELSHEALINKKNTDIAYWKYLVLVIILIYGSTLLISSINRLTCPQGFSGRKPIARNDTPAYGLSKVSFENVRNKTFTPEYKPLQWISTSDSLYDDRGLFVTFENEEYVVKSVFDLDYKKLLLKGKTFDVDGLNFTVDSFVSSPNLSRVLIRSQTVKNWRHSTFGTYFVYDVEKEVFQLIGKNIAHCQWAPNSDLVAYVFENDIYLHSAHEDKTVKRVTTDGSTQLFNGKPDWVYEEEVLEGDSALWWSPNSRYVTFYKINETEVPEYSINYYVQQENASYPEMKTIKYPKAGFPNPVVDLETYDFLADETLHFPLEDPSYIVNEVVWISDSQYLAKITNRYADDLYVHLIDVVDKKDVVTRSENAGTGWHELTHYTRHIPQNKTLGRPNNGYLDTIAINGWNHLVYFANAGNSNYTILTSGDWEVVGGACAFDYSTNDVYFVATKKSSIERHLYVVNLMEPLVITELTETAKEAWFSASFSSGGRFAVLTYGGPKVPYQKVIDFKSQKTDAIMDGNVAGETLFYLERNEKLNSAISKYDVPKKSFYELNLGKDESGKSIIVNSYEILPNNFNPKLKDYYPVFFFMYGGPNSQQVTNSFSVGFNEVVASQLNAIVVCVDGRGTGFKGKDFRSVVRDNLGDYEARDQITAAKIYGSKSYVNAEKISLFGWSYGGYMTLKTLEKDAGDHFKYGMAVAPVTDWKLYDSIYTERYMHTPELNPQGYNSCKVNDVKSIAKAKRFLLCHGLGDDNVHFQNMAQLMDKINLANVENYDMMVFPDSDHSIRYHNANNIVFDKLLSWAGAAFSGEFER